MIVILLTRKKKKKTLVEVCGVRCESIGVLSPFRAQVALVREELSGLSVEVGTVDSSQVTELLFSGVFFIHHLNTKGRDWACVVLTLARSNDARAAGELLEDWRRLNVAVSRAKSKLIVVADAATMQSVHVARDLCDLIKAQGWVVALPRDYTPS